MSMCSQCAAKYGEGAIKASASHFSTITMRSGGDPKEGESWLETALVAVVLGLTAQFIAFLFGLTAQFFDSLSENLLLSSLLGLWVGAIAFALMQGYDQGLLRGRGPELRKR